MGKLLSRTKQVVTDSQEKEDNAENEDASGKTEHNKHTNRDPK